MCVSRAAYRISSMESLDVHMNTKEGDVFSRDQSIVDLVSAKGLVDIHDLAEQFGVTPQTIRRSVNRLCEQGLLRRVHGGVTLPASVSNLPWDTRQVQQLDAKRAIALKVAALIPDGSSVSIGLGRAATARHGRGWLGGGAVLRQLQDRLRGVRRRGHR